MDVRGDAGKHRFEAGNGAVFRSLSRDETEYSLGGRTIVIGVDRGPASYGFYLPAQPAWNDGTPLTEAEVDEMIDVIAAVAKAWSVTAEFMRLPDGQWFRR